jgi:hypothetical protein
MLENISQTPITYLPFHSKAFWDNFYKNQIQDNNNINWYFDLTKLQTNDFSLKNFKKDDEILLIGPGLSSTLDYLDNNNFLNVTIFDFSEELTRILSEKYNKDNKEWEIDTFDITTVNSSEYTSAFSVIIDKACLDCILSDPKNGENKFIDALNNLLILLDEEGVIYYFSNGKIEDRINLFYKVPKIKYKVSTIDMNETMKEEYKEFNQSDNIYYLYIITKSE